MAPHPVIYYAYAPLAQSVEHLPFKQGVRSSNLRWVTNFTVWINFHTVFLFYLNLVVRNSIYDIINISIRCGGNEFMIKLKNVSKFY